MKKLFKLLENPFLLAAEGFIAGALIFWATTSTAVEARPNQPIPQAHAQIEAGFPL